MDIHASTVKTLALPLTPNSNPSPNPSPSPSPDPNPIPNQMHLYEACGVLLGAGLVPPARVRELLPHPSPSPSPNPSPNQVAKMPSLGGLGRDLSSLQVRP